MKREEKQSMTGFLPTFPISQEQLQALIGTMLVYKRYCLERTPPTEERKQTLYILDFLIPKLSHGAGCHGGAVPLWLTADDIYVMTGGLDALLKRLEMKPCSKKLEKERRGLKELQTIIKQFSATQD